MRKQSQKFPANRSRTSDLEIATFPLQSPALPTELSRGYPTNGFLRIDLTLGCVDITFSHVYDTLIDKYVFTFALGLYGTVHNVDANFK